MVRTMTTGGKTRTHPRRRQHAPARVKPHSKSYRSDFRLTSFVPYQVSILAANIRSGLLSVIDERFGLNIAEWRVFMAVGAFPPVTTKTISDYTTTAKAEVSRAVTRLVEVGYLVRVV